MDKTWNDIVNEFPTTPFLFVGSGLTRRYLGLPNWEELLKHFANIISTDEFIFQMYMNEHDKDYAAIGSAIEKDFNNKWFNEPSMRTNSEEVYSAVKRNISPFKAELAYYIKHNFTRDEAYAEEIALLQHLTEKNISGFITTNYDTFLEDITNGYKVYNNQEELIFSPIQEMAEIFKIHGSVSDPNSIVITAEDYQHFNDKCAYLAAKLLTIFMEYPIIFIGYSITDNDIQKILSAIVSCLSKHNVDKLQNRFIFVKRNTAITDDIKVGIYSKEVNGQNIFMTQLETNNFKLVYEPLAEKQATLPVKVLRFFKEQFYNFTLTSVPSKHIFVNAFDPNVPQDQLCCSIGQDSQSVLKGLRGIKADDWYKDVLLDNIIHYSSDEILSIAFEDLIKSNNALPIFKYLSQASRPYPEIIEKNNIHTYDELLNANIRNHRYNSHISKRTVNAIRQQCTFNEIISSRALYYLQFLLEQEINIDDLEHLLKDYLKQHPDILTANCQDNNEKSTFRRLVRILDWIKYHSLAMKKAPQQ